MYQNKFELFFVLFVIYNENKYNFKIKNFIRKNFYLII